MLTRMKFWVTLAGVLAAVFFARAQLAEAVPTFTTVDFGTVAAGASVVGQGVVDPHLTITSAGDFGAVAVGANLEPVAYEGTLSGIPVPNACVGSPESSQGMADVGSDEFRLETRLHDYTFTFHDDAVREFSVRLLDWGDFLPFGLNVSGEYAMVLAAYNSEGDIVDSDEVTFLSEDPARLSTLRITAT
jgi:hypothetical protein